MSEKYQININLELTFKHKDIFQVGYGIVLLYLIHEKIENGGELGLTEAHRSLIHLCPTFNSFRVFVSRLVEKKIIVLEVSQSKKNKKILTKGPKFINEIIYENFPSMEDRK